MRTFFDKLVCDSAANFYKMMEDRLLKKEKMFIVTANPETFMKGTQDEDFCRLLEDKRTTIVPDGIGIVKVCDMIGYPVKERIPGVEIAEKLLQNADDHHSKLALFGAKSEVLNRLKGKINDHYPNIDLVLAVDGYIKEKDQVMQEIAMLHPDIVLVALGIPAQEQLIYRHLNEFDHGILVGVGGSFDVMSGCKKRAPKIFIKCNLEWLYRIAKEPSRLGRFYKNNVKFIRMASKLKRRS